ncbi:hypothetical protein ES703_89180 [subsurface metagenome]
MVQKNGAGGNPVYEFLKKEDIEVIFRDALALAFKEITARMDNLISMYCQKAIFTPWTWGYTSRWGLDFWGKQN